jgi:hypothetical protein
MPSSIPFKAAPLLPGASACGLLNSVTECTVQQAQFVTTTSLLWLDLKKTLKGRCRKRGKYDTFLSVLLNHAVSC